jgi:hypothetical protein
LRVEIREQFTQVKAQFVALKKKLQLIRALIWLPVIAAVGQVAAALRSRFSRRITNTQRTLSGPPSLMRSVKKYC